MLERFKNHAEEIISQSNSYLHWAVEFNELCQAYDLGKVGDDVFAIVFKKLEDMLIAERNKQDWCRAYLEHNTKLINEAYRDE